MSRVLSAKNAAVTSCAKPLNASKAARATTVSRNTYSQREARKKAMVRRLYQFLACSRPRSSSPVRRWSNRLSRSTERGISNGGEPSRPTPSRISPSSGIIAFVASRQLAPVRPPAG